MTATQNPDNMTCTFISVDDLHDGHLTAKGTVVGEPQFSSSRKTVTVTVRKHSGGISTDKRSASAKVAVWVPKG